MVALSYRCDGCGKTLTKEEVFYDDPNDYCEKCYVESELEWAIIRYKEKRKWLHDTHIADLKERRTKIKELQERLLALNE